MVQYFSATYRPLIETMDPHRTGDIQKIESLFRSFCHQIKWISELIYWDRLSAIKLYSQERRMERYRIIYVWKIIEVIAPNVGIETYMSTRHGRLCKIPQIKLRVTGTIKTIREGSFQIRGPQLVNSLPANIRGLTQCTVNTFKYKLVEYLKNIPDTRKIPGYSIQTDITSMRSSPDSWAIQLRRSHRLGQSDYSQTLNLELELDVHV